MLVFEVLPLNKTLMRCGFLAIKTYQQRNTHVLKAVYPNCSLCTCQYFAHLGAAVGIHRALDRRPILTGRNLTNLWNPGPGYIDFYILDAPSRLKGGDLDKNDCL